MPGPRTRSLIALTLGLATAAVVVGPAHAAGTTVTNAAGVLTIGGGTQVDVKIAESTETAGYITVIDWTGSFGSVSGCEVLFESDDIIDCPGVDRVVVQGSSADDDVNASEVAVPVQVDAGAGNDYVWTGDGADDLRGGPGTDDLYGGAGDDTVDGGDDVDELVLGEQGDDTVTGGAGADVVAGGPGDDLVSGGAGADLVYGDDGVEVYDTDGDDTLHGDADADELHPTGGTDVIHGGTGRDLVSYHGYAEVTDAAVALSLDGQPNDGPSGENDNIGPAGDVEDLESPWSALTGPVTIVGDDGPNRLVVQSSSGAVHVDGAGGDDVVESYSSSPVPGTLVGGSGDDLIMQVLAAADTTILAGEGDDVVDGRKGAETVVGGPGRDQISTGDGSDTVDAVDGGADLVSCGGGADAASIDAVDVLASDAPSLCESVTTAEPPAPELTVPSAKRARIDAKGVATFRVSNRSDFAVEVVATAAAGRTVGSGKVALVAGGSGDLDVRLTKAARTTVKKKGKLKATLKYVARGGGAQTTITRTVVFVG